MHSTLALNARTIFRTINIKTLNTIRNILTLYPNYCGACSIGSSLTIKKSAQNSQQLILLIMNASIRFIEALEIAWNLRRICVEQKYTMFWFDWETFIVRWCGLLLKLKRASYINTCCAANIELYLCLHCITWSISKQFVKIYLNERQASENFMSEKVDAVTKRSVLYQKTFGVPVHEFTPHNFIREIH